jgi:diphosphomevalonate decarboxylase
MGKATAIAPANIAFVKYWGVRDLERVIPWNRSISMTLERCSTTTTVEHVARNGADEVLVAGERGALVPATEAFAAGARRLLDAVRARSGRGGSFRVATRNSFPAAAGLASSASGAMALASAAAAAVELELDPPALSALAASGGSGSAARSAFGGYVQWPAQGEGGPAAPLAPASHWDLRDVIAIVDRSAKVTSSREGHRRAVTSPYFAERQRALPGRLDAERRLDRLGPLVEEEAIDLHLIAMSSRPPIFYWVPATLRVLDDVRRAREAGIAGWATLDAGPNVHVICAPDDEGRLAARLAALDGVLEVIRDRVGTGPRLSREHLA